MLESKIIDLKNSFYAYFQSKFEKLTENSYLLTRIDDIIFFFISALLFVSTFMESEKIGALALVVVSLTFIKLFTQKGAKIRIASWDAAVFIYFVICFISTINSTLLPQSIHGFLKTVIYIFYYFCAANYFQTNTNKIKYIFLLVSMLCAAEGIIAIFQNFAGVEQISTWQDSNYVNPEDAIARAYGTLKPLNPNLLGGYLIAGIPYVIGTCAMCLAKKNQKVSWFCFTVFAICSFAVFVTGSRGAYLGLAAIVAGVIILTGLIIKADFDGNKRLKSIYNKVTAGIIALFAMVLIFVPKITKRLLSIFILRGDSSTSFRLNVYNSSWHMFCDNWILGIGSGNQTFREIYGLYMLTGYDALSTYSVPLEIAVESGILGLISFAAFLLLLLKNALFFVLHKSADEDVLVIKIIIASAILTILGVFTHGLFDTIFFRPQLQFLFWTMIAMAGAVMINKKQNNVS